jgi:hypothetical protein
MPTQREKGEEEKDFISRCMSETKNEFPDVSQRYAVCKSYADKSNEKMKKQDLFVLVPKKSENRGKYLARCSAHPQIKGQFSPLKERLAYCLTSFNEYYKYWTKIESFGEVPSDTALGDCITKEKAKGFDYKESYAHCASKVVVQPGPVVLAEDDMNMDVLGYMTKYFYICPGAVATFKDLISMKTNSDISRMIRNAAVIADSIFEIEDEVLEDKSATQEQLDEAILLVKDFYDLMSVIDGEVGMKHDVKYMDGHIEKIKSYIGEEMGDNLLIEPVEFADLEDACWEGYEPIGTKEIDGREVPNCVPIKMTEDDFADTINDYPDTVKNAAKRALDYADKNGWGGCGTGVGKQRANQLAKGENISVDTVKRMYSYLSRHKVDLQSSKTYEDGCGKLMYDSWGGESGLKWAETKLKQLEK